jgi:hypothetical protein
MLPASLRKMPQKTSKALALAALALSVSVSYAQKSAPKDAAKSKAPAELVAPAGGAMTVSDKELNTFVFPDTVKRILFPAGSPVVGEPIYLAHGTQVMLQFAKSDDSIQMIAELQDGTVHTLRVLPRPVQGMAHSISGAKARKPVPSRMEGSGAAAPSVGDVRAADIDLLKKVVMGEIPEDFSSVELPKPTRFDKFTVIPMYGWSDGATRRAYVFSLVANPGQVALVAAPQFYRPGITAVMLDGDVVDENNRPLLYVLEEVNDE